MVAGISRPTRLMPRIGSLVAAGLISLMAAGSTVAARTDGSAHAAHANAGRIVHPPGYVGAGACAACHVAEEKAWRASHHAVAMQPASPQTVAGHFDGSRITVRGVTSTFLRRAGNYWIRTQGHDGRYRDFRIAYTFGVYPLQQYLTPLPGGRLQALTVAWDARPRAAGGQRWYSLYTDEAIAPGDPLHWTGRNFTWNSNCAECHSTGVVRGYDLGKNSWKTSVSDLDVGCEACHGPGQRHLRWARGAAGAQGLANHGFTQSLRNTSGGYWGEFDARGVRQWVGARRGDTELEACAPCHSRRLNLGDGPQNANAPEGFHNGYSLSLLDDGLYFADGQIRDEVFEIGSFLQSKMHGAGVTCSDCHEPHGLKLRAPGNATCGACHDAARFDTPAHTHHAAGPATQCATCHIPTRSYMGVHERHDHSIRLPAPALAAQIGSPDPCLACHKDHSADSLAARIAQWTGHASRAKASAALAIAAGFRNEEGAGDALRAAANDTTLPPITRATALSLLGGWPSPESSAAVTSGMTDANPLVRLGAARALGGFAPTDKLTGAALLDDPARAVRVEAARQLAAVAPGGLPPAQAALRRRAEAEWVAAQAASAQRPENHINLASFWAEKGDTAKAEAALRTALRLEPDFVPGLINLADLYRALGQDAKARPLLQQAVTMAPRDADAIFAYALLLVREGNRAGALAALRQATALRPHDAQIACATALAMRDAGQSDEALALLRSYRTRFGADRGVIGLLAQWGEK